MNTFTLIHLLISLAGLAFGLVVLGGWIAGRAFRGSTILFLATTVLTSVTGFFFPFHGVTPGIVVGALSLGLLAAAIGALVAGWRTTYVVTALVALYLNFFVLVAQLFQHTPALKALAPTQAEPPFAVAQILVLALFAGLGVAAVRGFRVAAARS